MVAPARPAPDRPQQVVGRRGQRPGQIVDALLLHPVEDRRGPNQSVGVPYRRHAVGGHRLDLPPRLAVRAAIFDRLEALTFLEREQRAPHTLPLILKRERGRASCREIGGQYAMISVVPVYLTTKTTNT